ncbi:MAG TPA: Hint domain-containing protein [Acetobacteraceae bacterium]|nr:Hint domain-containing protein [Acetobacteraceae bacterium]
MGSTYTHAISLYRNDQNISQNPVTIGSGVYVHNTTSYYGGDGINGDAEAYWDLTNFGRINGPGTAGVYFAAGGNVHNETGATIYGGLDGVYLNDKPGYQPFIQYHDYGKGIVSNLGTIEGAGRDGVDLTAGGQVTNSALIGGGLNGVYIRGAAGSVQNNGGTITGTNGSGVFLAVGGSVTNFAGSIFGGDDGVLVRGAGPAIVTNDATIMGAAGDGVVLDDGGSVNNASNATIADGLDGIYVIGAPGTISNGGTIRGMAGSGVHLLASGNVSNAKGGYIYGADDGVLLQNQPGTVVNSGAIAGYVGVNLSDGGSATNAASGQITGGGGITVSGAAGTIANHGTIIATAEYTNGRGVLLNNGGYLYNSGLIEANGALAVLTGGATPATVVNNGTIDSNPAGGLYYFSVFLASGGTLANAGLIEGNPGGVAVANAGTIVNSGIIKATGGTGSSGVNLSGGYLLNKQGGYVYGYTFGVYVSGGTGTVVNLGSIVSGGTTAAQGVTFQSDGTVVNGAPDDTSALITGLYAIHSGGAGAVSNYGTINGSFEGVSVNGGLLLNGAGGATNALLTGSFIGASLGFAATTLVNYATVSGFIGALGFSSTTVVNQAGGQIYGYGNAINFGTSSTLRNFGTLSSKDNTVVVGNGSEVYNARGALITATNVSGSTGDGILLADGGSVMNDGSITASGDGISLSGAPGTVQNAGFISGAEDAVSFAGGYANRLIIDPGAVFAGTVNGGDAVAAAAVSTLELASGASTGTLTGLGSQYIGFAQITIDAGAAWQLNGANTIAAGATLAVLSGASLTGTGVLENDGTIVLDPSTMTVAGLTGTGSVEIGAGSTLAVQGTIAGGETVVFGGSSGYLHLDNPGSVTGSVTNFAVGDTIDLAGVNPASVSYSGGTLAFNGGSLALSLAGPGSVNVSSSDDGTAITALCFCANTLILTPSGERPVQDLAIGDLVTTWRGDLRPIAWVGIGKVLATRGRRNAATPVTVRKGALADNVPHRDLRVTKGHAFHLNDVLIPVEFLINHRSIAWDDRAQEVELYHIELESHDVLVANGAPAESYHNDGNRWLFQNAGTGRDLPPLAPCAPVLTGGAVVDRVWRRLLDRAGPRPGVPLTGDPDLHLLVDGRRLDAVRRQGDRYVFRLTGRPDTLRIVSRTGSPQELGLARDPRSLGVAVRQIMVTQGKRVSVIDAADPLLSDGFHAFEEDNGFRWTDGGAVIASDAFAGVTGPCDLVLHIGGTASYVADACVQRAA